MTSQLKVDELRAQLAKRGLSTAGIKPTLVKRLESAIKVEEDKKQISGANNDSKSSRKRQRHDEETDANDESNEVKAMDEFWDMNVKQLRNEASSRGISISGTKKELIERLCDHAEKNSTDKEEEAADDAEEQQEVKEEKLITATKKGAAVLDPHLPHNIKAQYHVLQNGNDIYDAILNQTNVGDNNNKFFVIQVLESDGGGKFMFYNRWGRVGSKGQNKLIGPCTKDAAIRDFESKFFGKTKNHWANREEFVSFPKCYTWLEMDYDEAEEGSSNQGVAKPSVEIQPRETKLENRIAKFISLICSISMMKQHMMEIGYNAEKLPLGKLSKSTILKGYDVLKRLSDVIGQSDRRTLEQLSGEFYTVIPHDFGYRKMRDFVIDTPQKLKSKLQMVEALGEIEVAAKLLKDDIEMQEDPLYHRYQRLHCDLTPVEVNSNEYTMINTYMKNTHAKTHSSYTVDIVQIFKVSREGEAERFEKFSKSQNRMLLWHGSRLTNWTGILSQGLRIAPPEAPVTGYMFGKGVYFADMFSKSANYCCSTPTATDGVLLLCEVALGEMAELLAANYNADKLPVGKLSTKGVGATAPDLSKAQTLEDGLVIPLGNPKDQPGPRASLLYNEYIVYNVEQIRMRYVLQVKFNYGR